MWAETETEFLKPMLLKTDKTGLDYLWAKLKSSGSGQLRRWRCDVERARHSTRAQGPSHMLDTPYHHEDDKVVQEGCSRWATRLGSNDNWRGLWGTPQARSELNEHSWTLQTFDPALNMK